MNEFSSTTGSEFPETVLLDRRMLRLSRLQMWSYRIGEVIRVTIGCEGAMLGTKDERNEILTMHHQPRAVAHDFAL